MKRFHVSKNKFNINTYVSPIQVTGDTASGLASYFVAQKISVPVELIGQTVTFSVILTYNSSTWCRAQIIDGETTVNGTQVYTRGNSTVTFTATATSKIHIQVNGSDALSMTLTKPMLNTGSEALPYEPYGDTWQTKNPPRYGTATDVITSFPSEIKADGTNASADILGNMVQSGTPTPVSQITPSECGDRTSNLWNEDYTGISGTVTYKPLYVGEGTFTMSSDVEISAGSAGTLFLLAGNVSSGASTVTNGVYKNHDVTTTAIDGYVTVAYRTYSVDTPVGKHSMLNTGDTALLYQPYGYKLDIKSGNTTTPVYLGQVESTRKIKKWVLTGEESWGRSDNCFRLSCPDSSNSIPLIISTHFESKGAWALVNGAAGACVSATYYTAAYKFLLVRDDNIATTTTDFKTYLQQQYSAGTPVTVWYVLAEPTTGIVNEPLRKIGDYADTVSGITIPTITGKDSFDVQTTLKPSEVDLTYHGWHDASVKEWDGSEWQ